MELMESHIDMLKEVGNIGAGNAVIALSQLMNKHIIMNIPTVEILEFKDLASIIGGEENIVFGSMSEILGEINGVMMFVLEQDSCITLINTLQNNYEGESIKGDYYKNNLLEKIGSVISNAYLSSMSTLMGIEITSTKTQYTVDMAGAILSVPAIVLGQVSDKAMLVQNKIGKDNEEVKWYFMFIPDEDSSKKIIVSLEAMG